MQIDKAKLSLRLAAPSEMDSIYMMGFDVWSEGDPEKQYLYQCRTSEKYKRGKWYVLQSSAGTPICSLISYGFGPNTVGIGSIATEPKLRGQGLASLMIQKLLDELVLQGFKLVYLYSDVFPTIYERLGFVALPQEFQKYPHSTCMVWGAQIDQLVMVAGYQPPKYF